jgi:hypothetical protein
MIEAKNLSKHFKTLKKEPGFMGAVKGLFSRKYKVKKAVDGISFRNRKGRDGRLHRCQWGGKIHHHQNDDRDPHPDLAVNARSTGSFPIKTGRKTPGRSESSLVKKPSSGGTSPFLKPFPSLKRFTGSPTRPSRRDTLS